MFSRLSTFSSSPIAHPGTLKSFNCTTRRAECECDHLTDFGALLKYNFAKLEKALIAPTQDPKSFLLGLMVVLAPVFLFAIVLIKSGIRLVGRRVRGRKTAQGEDDAADASHARGRAGTRTRSDRQGGFGVALGVNNLRKNRTSVVGSSVERSVCSLYCRAFVDNHEVAMAFCAHAHDHGGGTNRGAILITSLYGNFFACTVLFYVYYCRVAGNSSNLRLEQLLLMSWFWGDKILISLIATAITLPFDSKAVAPSMRTHIQLFAHLTILEYQ